jgi:hypothetical protein
MRGHDDLVRVRVGVVEALGTRRCRTPSSRYVKRDGHLVDPEVALPRRQGLG